MFWVVTLANLFLSKLAVNMEAWKPLPTKVEGAQRLCRYNFEHMQTTTILYSDYAKVNMASKECIGV